MAFTPFTESDQPTMDAFNQKFQEAINDAVSKGLKVETGTYIGTGTYGESNPTSISFSKTPELIFVSGLPGENTHGPFFAIKDGQGVNVGYGSETQTMNDVVWGKTVSWYTTTNERVQMNESGRKYVYIGILEGSGA